MAENLYLGLTVEVAMERYGLQEEEWVVQSFTDGAKAIAIGLVNVNNGSKLRASFDRFDIRFEEMKRWDDNKKLLYLKHLENEKAELPPELEEAFQDVLERFADFKLEEVTDVEDTVIVEDGAEESAEEYEAKVEGKKRFKRKPVTA